MSRTSREKEFLSNDAHTLDAFGREIDPMGLTENLDRLRTEYGNPPVIITENGCSDPFSTGPAILDDGFRIAHFACVAEAAG